MFRLAQLSLGNRALIALITILASVFGVITLGSLKQELIPSLEFPQITVLSTVPGASPNYLDQQVSEPLEAALSGVEGLDSSTSTSRTGVSTISLVFAYGTDLDRARAQVDRAISTVRPSLPEDVEPQALAGSISDLPIVFMAVSSDRSLSELNGELTRLTVPRLQKIDGVRTADVSGGTRQHVAILPRDGALRAAGLTIADLTSTLEDNGSLLPVGTLEEDPRALTIEAGSRIGSLEDIEALPVLAADGPAENATGPAATIGDLADVSLTDDEPTSVTRTNGVETLALTVTKVPDGDTVEISQQIVGLVPELEAELGDAADITVIFDQAPFIERSIDDLTTEGILGLGFAVLIILIFLLSVRSTLVTAISIPLSLLITFIGLYAAGYSLNLLTLGALTIAIGRVVDDSIVVIENIKRHLGYGEEKREAILTAVREVAGAITASTLTTVAVFAPIAFVGGLAGELFRPFAVTTGIALLASLAVSLTIVPVLAFWFLPRTAPAGRSGARHAAATEGEATGAAAASAVPERASFLQRGYLPILSGTQRHPVITLISGVIVLGATAAMVPFLPTNLLSGSGQNSFSLTQTLAPGSSLATTTEAAARTEEILAATPEVRDIQLTVGNAEGGFAAQFSGGASVATFTVTTDEEADQEALQASVRDYLEDLTDAGTFSLSSQQGGFGTSSTIDVDITAPVAEDLEAANAAVLEGMAGLDGAGEVTSNLSSAQPQVQIDVDRSAAVAAGLTEGQIAGLLGGSISPVPAGSVRFDAQDYPVLIGEGTPITSLGQLRDLRVPTAEGPVPLTDVASVQEVQVPLSVTSSNGQRTARVSITPSGDDLGTLTTAVNERLEGIDLPASATATVGGASSQQAESFDQLFLALWAAVAIVYVIMVATFKSLVQPLILLVSIPFAATGAIALLLITGIPLGLPSLIGMLMLVGIVVTNAIVLIDLINQYRLPRDGVPGLRVAEAIREGARRRLRPILMTALATIFALTPMALGLTGEGGFISQPLAVVVIGGLVSSTALTLVLVPVLYHLVEGRREDRALRRVGATATDSRTR
ncbi:efflux RND transporter permease subunit [Arthrobacter agilis]|uniref:efflux RND transporter permease subunit n=1 Tax=Arthrobacter agilis TaxID=37921 RepID=UPI000B35AF55|nr:efflux RND transporter permease subunit [Arthrobacter agilis]OUM44137.1 hydrogenase expression protein [Arthrobacter agilis]PPB46513.1 AcrB/AcrD/AcrF family protein [Arthrobacter agilis]TPV23831.1 efflux RND transporter permease subunit [Arthrobacter agilis]VDR32567.1 Swarming motility protein SwrC [Arthrobacter agilis]